ncbi:hypothetical protein ROHU_003338 [Labeo rohita]|uniref:CxC3 like cysteine cluster domain-containing protein n=1 Tax=Labeo rohita TaxID=84645 RepID=A0A498MUP6_LABRO|nr:hypothetical protein ROHU_006419 [Labeo rohita]RXN36007.1 hypothetical protein ROHU_003338 [Labeo rohita]
MDSKHKLDSQDPHYQEGRRMALELKLDRVLAEARAIPPTSHIIKGQDGYCIHEQACILPTVKVLDCSCDGTNFTILPGKPVILITINGRFDLHQPLYVCQSCQHQWSPDVKELMRSGYWPASVTSSTLYTLDLLSSFQELKVISPGFSRQAFAKLLEHRTKIGGRMKAAQRTVLKEVVTKDCAEGSGLAQ